MTQGVDSQKTRRALRMAAIGLAAVFVTGCAGAGGTSGGAPEETAAAGGGVPWGSPAEDFAAALEDMEPIQIHYALGTSSEANIARAYTEWAEYIEEYSGGKITVELSWASSAAALTDMDTKILGGVVDAGLFGAYYNPDKYPVAGIGAGALLAPLMGGDPVAGYFVNQAASTEWGFRTPEYVEEITNGGEMTLLAASTLTYPQTLLCKGEPGSTSAGLQGRSIGVTTASQGIEVGALGAEPVSAVITEIYQMMDRGIMDCMVGSFALHVVTGSLELANYWTIDPNVSFSSPNNAFLFSGDVWDELPLAARQIIFDASIVQKGWLAETTFEDYANYIKEAEKYNIEFSTFDADVRKELGAAQEGQIDEVIAGKLGRGFEDAEASADLATELRSKWQRIIVDLGYPDDIAWGQEFVTYFEENGIDVEPFIEAMYDEFYSELRPS